MLLINRNKFKLKLVVLISLVSLTNLLGQCIIPNGDFKSSEHKKNNLWYPSGWTIQGKYAWVYDDNKPYINKRKGKTTYIYTRDLFDAVDTSKKEIFAILSEIPKQGRRYKQIASVKLIEKLERDSVYEISVDISFKSGGVFAYNYYPIFFTSTPKYNKKNGIKVDLYNTDKAQLDDGKWYTIKLQYKANGTESYFHLTDDLDYASFLKVINVKKDKEATFYKYSVYLDNLCIKKVSQLNGK